MVQRLPAIRLVSREDAVGDNNFHPVHVGLEDTWLVEFDLG